MTSLLDHVDRHGARYADPNGTARTALPGLSTVRATSPSGLIHAVSRPLACLVVQGEKHVTTGASAFTFGAGDTLLIAADVPTVSQITRASAAEPYLSVVLEIDPGVITDLVAETGPALVTEAAPVQVDPTVAEVADTALRLLRLLDRPAALTALQSSLVREMHYWLLAGKHGAAIRRLGWPDGHAQRISRAVTVLRAEYARTIPVEQLAAEAGMSPSSFHQHFRAQTSLSPRQFQKQLRLIEARRLMMGDGLPASRAAYAVGYESVSQFTREYRRMFGAPPAAEAAEARRLSQAA